MLGRSASGSCSCNKNRGLSRYSEYGVRPWCPVCRDGCAQSTTPPAQQVARNILARALKAQEDDHQQQEERASRLQNCVTAGCKCHSSIASAFRRLQLAKTITNAQIRREFDRNLCIWRNRRYHRTLQHTMHALLRVLRPSGSHARNVLQTRLCTCTRSLPVHAVPAGGTQCPESSWCFIHSRVTRLQKRKAASYC